MNLPCLDPASLIHGLGDAPDLTRSQPGHLSKRTARDFRKRLVADFSWPVGRPVQESSAEAYKGRPRDLAAPPSARFLAALPPLPELCRRPSQRLETSSGLPSRTSGRRLWPSRSSQPGQGPHAAGRGLLAFDLPRPDQSFSAWYFLARGTGMDLIQQLVGSVGVGTASG